MHRGLESSTTDMALLQRPNLPPYAELDDSDIRPIARKLLHELRQGHFRSTEISALLHEALRLQRTNCPQEGRIR